MNTRKQDQLPIYQIRIKGHLENGWSDWFENLAIHLEADGNTLLEGPIADQAALYSILKKVHQLGLQLISVNKIDESKKLHNPKRRKISGTG